MFETALALVAQDFMVHPQNVDSYSLSLSAAADLALEEGYSNFHYALSFMRDFRLMLKYNHPFNETTLPKWYFIYYESTYRLNHWFSSGKRIAPWVFDTKGRWRNGFPITSQFHNRRIEVNKIKYRLPCSVKAPTFIECLELFYFHAKHFIKKHVHWLKQCGHEGYLNYV